MTLLKQFFPFLISLFLPFSSLLALNLPEDLADVSEPLPGANGKTIYLIQEAHVDYNAQKSIAQILERLFDQEDVHLILVEGGWGDVSLSYLRGYAPREGRLDVAEQFLREGRISGEEYLDLITEHSLDLWGIEDPGLYRENMEAFLKMQPDQEKLSGEFRKWERCLDPLEAEIFPPALRELLSKARAFEKQSLSLVHYLQYVSSLPESRELLARYPDLKNWMDLVARTEQYDLSNVQWEREELVRALSRKLTKPEIKALEVARPPRTPKEEMNALSRLLSVASRFPKIEAKVRSGSLSRYQDLLREMNQTQSDQIFDRLKKMEGDLEDLLAPAGEAEQLLRIRRISAQLEKLFELKLTPPEFEALEQQLIVIPEWFCRGSKMDSRLKPCGNDNVLNSHFSMQALDFPDWDLLFSRVPLAKKFYGLALKREEAFITNSVKRMDERRERVAALIIGGFHADRLAQAFQKRGYTVVPVSPRFVLEDPQGQQQKYFEILKYKWGHGGLPYSNQGGLPQHAAKN